MTAMTPRRRPKPIHITQLTSSCAADSRRNSEHNAQHAVCRPIATTQRTGRSAKHTPKLAASQPQQPCGRTSWEAPTWLYPSPAWAPCASGGTAAARSPPIARCRCRHRSRSGPPLPCTFPPSPLTLPLLPPTAAVSLGPPGLGAQDVWGAEQRGGGVRAAGPGAGARRQLDRHRRALSSAAAARDLHPDGGHHRAVDGGPRLSRKCAFSHQGGRPLAWHALDP